MRNTSKNMTTVNIPKIKGSILTIVIMMGIMEDFVGLAFKTVDFFTTPFILLLWPGVVLGVLEEVLGEAGVWEWVGAWVAGVLEWAMVGVEVGECMTLSGAAVGAADGEWAVEWVGVEAGTILG
jgi:hypothetical protein